jgi:hypothetical protein
MKPCCAAMFSHMIRGRKGNQASPEEMAANCAKATKDMTQLGSMLLSANLPVVLHIPGANDLFVQYAFKAGRITEADVLATDCDIIATCDFLLVYDWAGFYSTGMKVEIDYAEAHEIPVLIVTKLDQVTYIDTLRRLATLWQDKHSAPQIIKMVQA